MDFVKWMFGSFWRFIGVLLLAAVVFDGGASLLLAIRGKPSDCPHAAPTLTMQTPDGNTMSLNINAYASGN